MKKSKLTKENSIKESDALYAPKRLPVAIDAVGKLQFEYDKMGVRLAKLKTGLLEVLPQGFDAVEGASFVAKRSESPVRKLKESVSNHTLLTKLLLTIDEQEDCNGGLFDMILRLDQGIINTHFVPLLEAVFEKAQLSSDARLLFLVDTHLSVEITPMAVNT